jgi:hypothetical protein
MAAAIPPLMQANQAAQTNRIGTTSMFVCMHEASSARYDFKTAMEGYAKAGIRGVEPDLTKVREFAMKESPADAHRLLDDLASLELFQAAAPALQDVDPYQMAVKAKAAIEPLIV